MKAVASVTLNPSIHVYPSPVSRQISFRSQRVQPLPHNSGKGLKFYRNEAVHSACSVICALNGDQGGYVSAWDDKPYEFIPNGKRAYLDEQDVVTFLDPPKELIPLDSTSYNPAAYLWKKIDDIPQERRRRLLRLLEPRLISRAWEIAGTRYDEPKLMNRSSSQMSSNEDGVSLEYYNCRTSGGPMPISWINYFKMALFTCKDGNLYGRFIGDTIVNGLAKSVSPLYFVVRQLKEVMATEQPCDLAYEFGDGLFDLLEYPKGFPTPVKHPYPFDDQVVVYVRQLGPGVSVGQAWQEGKELQQVPQKLCGEILMVKDYSTLREDQ
ncbi:uncharacterized protein LOC126799479 [Argentina anserina]|uniref:uncharacterized protein LOC126799479 n=1 Tax=Argentina anserina TaxID=57926 RepID=UPI0021762402|nr:uncharacterized protein LOC126799479 [Potentilla anserina]